jgi:hypothetical protein
MSELVEHRLGRVVLEPDGSVVAGSMMEWTFTYTAGSYGVDEGGVIMLVQRIAADMQKPQFEFPKQPAYTSVATSADCRLSCRFQTKQHARPWQKWCLVIDVLDGSIRPGETILLMLGDRSHGSPGIRAQTFVEKRHEFRLLIDPTNAATPRHLPSSPVLQIIPDKTTHLLCLLPAQLTVGESTEIFVRGADRWGNPTPSPDDIHLGFHGLANGLIAGGMLRAQKPGIAQVTATSGNMKSNSNPVEFTEKSSKYRRYWGDLHAQTESTVGTGSENEYFTFARNQARLDFTSHQGNDFQLTDEDWRRLNRVIRQHHESGKFVIIPGYEWSGNTSAGGDHNVLYSIDDQPLIRSSHWQVPEVPEDEITPAHPVDQLFEKLKRNGNAMVIPHVGGRPADVGNFFDEDIEHVVEILSCHGVFEWLLWDALAQGRKVGVVCNSDGHKGRPGSEGPGAGQFGIGGGLTCVFAEELSRNAIFNALKSRRCYGTTGARMNLWVEADGHMMGEELTAAGDVTIIAKVHGTAPLERLTLMRGREELYTVRQEVFNNLQSSSRIRISWGGAKMKGRARRATWDGLISVSGIQILRANTFAFDSPADGIVSLDEQLVRFRSSTTGDIDGIDLLLSSADKGVVSFSSPIGNAQVDLYDLGPEPNFSLFGGVDLHVVIQRYPERIDSDFLAMNHVLSPPKNTTTPYMIKAVQEDGQMAWSSPIFITGE